MSNATRDPLLSSCQMRKMKAYLLQNQSTFMGFLFYFIYSWVNVTVFKYSYCLSYVFTLPFNKNSFSSVFSLTGPHISPILIQYSLRNLVIDNIYSCWRSLYLNYLTVSRVHELTLSMWELWTHNSTLTTIKHH